MFNHKAICFVCSTYVLYHLWLKSIRFIYTANYLRFCPKRQNHLFVSLPLNLAQGPYNFSMDLNLPLDPDLIFTLISWFSVQKGRITPLSIFTGADMGCPRPGRGGGSPAQKQGRTKYFARFAR